MYKYLVLAIGATILSSGTCNASWQAPAPTPQAGQVQAASGYQEVLSFLPEADLARRDQFLADVWKNKQNDIRGNVPEASALQDWSQATEEIKGAVQNYIQHQGHGFFSGIPECFDYGNGIEDTWLNQAQALSDYLEIKDDDLKNLLTIFKKVNVPCPGCALTADLIMSTIRQACVRLADNPTDTVARNALIELHNVISAALQGKDSIVAHDIPNLPEIATSVETSIRGVLAAKIHFDLTSRELGEFLALVNQADNSAIGPFAKSAMRTKIQQIQDKIQKKKEYQHGISSDDLKQELYSDQKVKKYSTKIDELIDKVAPKSPAMSSDGHEQQDGYRSFIAQVRDFVANNPAASIADRILYVTSLNPNANLANFMSAIEVNEVYRPATNAAIRMNDNPNTATEAGMFADFIRDHPEAAEKVAKYIGNLGRDSFKGFMEWSSSQY